MPVIFSIPKWQVSYDACFSFWYELLLFHWHQSNIQEYSTVCVLHHRPPSPQTLLKYISIPPSLSVSPTHRARLLVQEDVCSAHFNMNIIILYLAAIHFPCHKPTQASSFFFFCFFFYSGTLRDKNHRHFPQLKCHYVNKKKIEWAATSIFDGHEKTYAIGVNI